MPRPTSPAAATGLPETSRPALIAGLQRAFDEGRDALLRVVDLNRAMYRLDRPEHHDDKDARACMTLAGFQDNDLQEVEQQFETARRACEALLGVPVRLVSLEERAAMAADAVRRATACPAPQQGSGISGAEIVDRIDGVRRKALLLDLAAYANEDMNEKIAAEGRNAMREAIDELGDMLGQLSADVSLGLQQPGGADAEG